MSVRTAKNGIQEQSYPAFITLRRLLAGHTKAKHYRPVIKCGNKLPIDNQQGNSLIYFFISRKNNTFAQKMFRIGFGYDVHKLAEGEKLIIGGVEIPHNKGTVGHSDADVLIHAIIDALLGAAAMKDIGYWFSDKDPKYKNIDSKILLKKTIEIIAEKNYKVGNIDATIALQTPKIKPYIDQMRQIIAETINTHIDNISIKATTTEKLGFEGRQEGVSAYAVALIFNNN